MRRRDRYKDAKCLVNHHEAVGIGFSSKHARKGTNLRDATLKVLAYSTALVAVCNIIECSFDLGGSALGGKVRFCPSIIEAAF